MLNLLDFAGGMNIGIWERMKDIENPNLAQKAEGLPFLIKNAWAESTNRKYGHAWDKWSGWCDKYPEVIKCPADPFYLALYFNDLVIEDSTLSAVKAANSGIRWGHLCTGHTDPFQHPFGKLAFEGAKRLCSANSSSNQKEPFTTEMLMKVYETYGRSRNLMHKRFILICLLGFAGFLRRSELTAIKVIHIAIYKDHMTITIPESKTDQLREGEIVHISRTLKNTCPVAWTENYIKETQLSGEDYLISRLAKTKTSHNAIGTRPLSLTSLRRTFFQMMEPLWGGELKKKDYSLHSLRSGGASAAANNGVSDRLIGKQGRWSSTSSKDTYIKDSKCKRLSVTQKLGL